MKSKVFCFLFLTIVCASLSYSQWTMAGNATLGSYNLIYGGALSSKSGVVWAGLHELWKSIDTGVTWTKTNLNTGGSFVSEINFFDQNIGAVCIYNQGVFLTRDGGNSWTNILSMNHCLGVAFNRTKDEILVADRDNLVGTASYSSDGGVSWKTQRIETNTYSGAYQLLTSGDGKAYILSRTYQQGAHIFESSDFGLSWRKHQSDVDLDSYSFAIDSCNPKQIYIGNEEYNQIDNGFSEIYSSTDNGDTWISVNKQSPNFFSSACATSQNAVFAATSGSGVYRSTDAGKTWKSIGGPSSHCDSRMLTVINDNIIFAIDYDGSIWRTTNSGGSPIVSSMGGSLSFTLSSARIIKDSLGVNVYLPIYLKASSAMPSLDMIVHYPTLPLEYIKSILPSGKSVDVAGGAWPGRAKLHFDAADLAARKDSLIGYCVFKWSPYEYDCSHILFDSMQAVIPEMPCSGKITALSSATDGLIGSYPSCGLALETDIDPPQFIPSQNKDHSSDTLLVNDGRSTDEGLKSITWVAEKGTDTTKVVVMPVTPPVIPCYDDKINHRIRVVQLDSTADGCYDFTFTDCLWHKSYDTICFNAHLKSGVQVISESPLVLDANHPNPFSHITTLSYSTGEYGMVRLYLYDELGREVARIINMSQPSGSHSIDFDGSKLASGNYIVRLESGGKALSRRVVIER